jgi:hypothetical protein
MQIVSFFNPYRNTEPHWNKITFSLEKKKTEMSTFPLKTNKKNINIAIGLAELW